MTGHQTQQPQKKLTNKQSQSKQKQKQHEQQRPPSPPPTQPTIDVDELAKEKVDEIERSLKQLTSFKLDAFNSWFNILKQIITAADLHRTNDKDKDRDDQSNKPETGDSIYADYGDDNERFTAQVDLGEQFATNSVKWTIRVHAFKIVHRLLQLLASYSHGGSNGTANGSSRLSPILIRYLPDLVRLSFVAATSPYDELKMQGFEMFKFLIEKFAHIEEKEFPGHSILEQYKTQVLSAVKPAFNPDAPPYITAIASQICSLWICQGLEKEFSDVKRNYQLMLLSIEKLERQSVNQHSKLYTESELEQERVDILGSWAQLYIASMEFDLLPEQYGRLSRLSSVECRNLNSLVKPQLEVLVEKWWEALKDYALLIMPSPKFIGVSHDNEHVYTREVALRLFSPTWPKLVLAVTIKLCKEEDGQEPQPEDKTVSSVDCDSETTSQSLGRISKTKYSKFLCGILMKELSRCLISSGDSASPEPLTTRQLAESTAFSLKSLYLLLSNPELHSVFLDDMAIAQEFYTALYCITVAYCRDHSIRSILRNTLDLLFKMTVKKISNEEANVHYALAKLVSCLMVSMKNIEIACRQSSLVDLDYHKMHFALRLENLLTLVTLAPESTMNAAPLQEALITVLQEVLRFDQEPSVSLSLVDQLKDLYPAIPDEHRAHIIDELHPELCKRVQGLLSSLLESGKASDKDKLEQCQLEAFLKATRAAISGFEARDRTRLISSFIESTLKPIERFSDKMDDLLAIEGKIRREIAEHCIKQTSIIKETFPSDFSALSIEVRQRYEQAVKLQQDIKSQIELRNKKSLESKKSTNAKSSFNKPSTAKITLKADFSNFYSKKPDNK